MAYRTLTLLILTFLVIKSNNSSSYFVRIYSNQAEFIRPLDRLPLEFTIDEWNDIRSDSITLLSENMNITSQTITEKQKSLNGAKILIRSPMSFDKNTMILVPGILIDENINLVRIDDESITGHPTLFFTVSSDHIFYLEQPTTAKFYVNFTYTTTDSKVNISYLQSNLKWHTQYKLNLYDNQSTLIAMANIRNNGKSSVSIDHAELIGGQVNLNAQPKYNNYRSGMHERTGGIELQYLSMVDVNHSPPMIEQGQELTGLYIFTISKPFIIDAKTDYLLPMFRPQVTVERYGLISKYFHTTTNSDKAQRAYRLRSDRFISNGNCIVREMDRIVGETFLPNLAAKDKFEFSLGTDPDIVYKENVTLISSIIFNEEDINSDEHISNVNRRQRHTSRTQSVYEIHLQIKSYKARSVLIEYEQKDLTGYKSVKLTILNDHLFTHDSSIIKSSMLLNAYAVQTYSYTIELIQ
ncbi:hypothetical protein I4U23_000306 [Adineta vaga]|nr:hypothetical protein I4U23_000306 [Adineta vaga]